MRWRISKLSLPIPNFTPSTARIGGWWKPGFGSFAQEWPSFTAAGRNWSKSEFQSIRRTPAKASRLALGVRGAVAQWRLRTHWHEGGGRDFRLRVTDES